jgi:hypothetical protein
MPRRTKLDFEPLSLEETAKQLGIPRRRAQQILALFGADAGTGLRRSRPLKRRNVRSKSPRAR